MNLKKQKEYILKSNPFIDKDKLEALDKKQIKRIHDAIVQWDAKYKKVFEDAINASIADVAAQNNNDKTIN